MKETYDLKYFWRKFSSLDNWCTKRLQDENGNFCANGHCNVQWKYNTNLWILETTEESKALQKFFSLLDVTDDFGPVEDKQYNFFNNCVPKEYSNKAGKINNGETNEYQQETPKQRILAALKDIAIKLNINLEEEEKQAEIAPKREKQIVYVDNSYKEAVKDLILN